MKYRIIKESKNDSISYLIQIKILFWIDCPTKSCYRLSRLNGSLSSYMLSKCVFKFKTEDKVREHLEKYHINRFKEKYKGNFIELRFSENYEDVYINRSKLHKMYGSSSTYESSHNLEELKRRIDSRIIKIKREVV